MNSAEKLGYAFKLLAQISVRGDDVERMAAARSMLREVYAEVNKDGGQESTGPSKD